MYPPMIHQHTLQSWKIMESQSESIQTPSLTQTNISFPLFFPFSMLFQLSDLEHLGLEQKSNNPLYLPRPFAGWGRGGVQLEYSLTYPNPRGGVIHKEQHLRVPPAHQPPIMGIFRAPCVCPRRNTCLLEGIGDR